MNKLRGHFTGATHGFYWIVGMYLPADWFCPRRGALRQTLIRMVGEYVP